MKIHKCNVILIKIWFIKTFSLNIDVINGVVQEPQKMYFDCIYTIPKGLTTIRYFDLWMNQFAHKTFYFLYKGDLFGASNISTEKQFWDYTSCYSQNFLLNDCVMQMDGLNITL